MKSIVILGKTFHISLENEIPILKISMFDTQKRIDKAKAFCKKNNIKIKYIK